MLYNLGKDGFLSIEVIILTSIVIIFGLVSYMVFTKDSREVLDTSKGGLRASIADFDVETKTRFK